MLAVSSFEAAWPRRSDIAAINVAGLVIGQRADISWNRCLFWVKNPDGKVLKVALVRGKVPE